MCSLKSFRNTFFLFCVLTWGVIDVHARFAKIEDYPFQVSVEHNEVPICGGAIIGDYWVITAGSCVPEDHKEVKNLRIRAGSQKLGTGGALHTAAKMVKFSGSFFAQVEMDIGLIKVEVPFMYATNIQWSEPAIELLQESTDIKLSGWGLGESHHGGEGKVLRDATVQVIPDNECREKFEGKLNITKAMACLAPAGEYDNACLGDVGSPIAVTGLISAVVSNNDYCWENDYPTVVTNIGNAGFFLAFVMSEPIIRNFSANAFPDNEF